MEEELMELRLQVKVYLGVEVVHLKVWKVVLVAMELLDLELKLEEVWLVEEVHLDLVNLVLVLMALKKLMLEALVEELEDHGMELMALPVELLQVE